MTANFSDILADAQALDREIRSRLGDAAKDAADKGRDKALDARRWKDRTGATRDAIRATNETTSEGGMGTLTADSENAVRLMDGTPPHEIRARGGSRSALRFEVGGQTVFRRVVHHPGTAPDDFMEQAGDAMEEQLESAVDQILGDLLG